MGPKVTPLDPTTVKSVVEFGTVSDTYTQSANGTSEVYSQIYPFEGLLNYTSGIIHHVRITGNVLHFYRFPLNCILRTKVPQILSQFGL